MGKKKGKRRKENQEETPTSDREEKLSDQEETLTSKPETPSLQDGDSEDSEAFENGAEALENGDAPMRLTQTVTLQTQFSHPNRFIINPLESPQNPTNQLAGNKLLKP